MTKTTFCFTLAVLVAIDVAQRKHRRKPLAQRADELGEARL